MQTFSFSSIYIYMDTSLNFKTWLQDVDDFSLIKEEIATWDQIEDKDALYQSYAQTYSAAGLKPWTQHDYEWRAEKWTFVGVLPKPGIPPDKVGFVTARNKNGIYKLTGMQGPNQMAKVKGLVELSHTGAAIWGAMDKDFTERLKKLDFSSPPPKAMKMLYSIIQKDPQFSSGGEWGALQPDGGIQFELSGVGPTVKYFTANKKFYAYMIDKFISSGKINPKLMDLLKKWNSIPGLMKKMALVTAKPFLPPGMEIDVESVDWLASIVSDGGSPKSTSSVVKEPQPLPV